MVTGGAGGIGQAIAARLLRRGRLRRARRYRQAKSLDATVADFSKRFGKDAVAGVNRRRDRRGCGRRRFREAVLAYGGIDIVVANAGIASAAPFEDTSLELWNRNFAILATGYFLSARAGYRIMKDQGLGGSIVFIASKNALAASPGARPIAARRRRRFILRAASRSRARPTAFAPTRSIPDAVLRGSKIWQGEWRAQRAASNKVSESELEEVYRQRSLLKLSVYPEDIAEAVYYFASDLSAKSTGNILNVDAGNAESFTR